MLNGVAFAETSTSRSSFLSPNISNKFSFLWLEITRKCNLNCIHCYADSSPSATHGDMSRQQWHEVIDDAHQMGVKHVQFIGGEPTIHKDLPELICDAAAHKMSIEVYSNLIHISPSLWKLFERLDVSLATSFYSVHPGVQNEITKGPSQEKTLANIKQAISRGIKLRIGMVDVLDKQDIPETIGMLRDLGVKNIRVDRSRGVGRAQLQNSQCDVNELCGKCGYAKAAIDCDGDVFPCVFSRWLCVGNVLSSNLKDVLLGKQMSDTQQSLDAQFRARLNKEAASRSHFIHRTLAEDLCPPEGECSPECTPNIDCPPNTCIPSQPDCAPTPGPIPCDPEGCPPNFNEPDPECTPTTICTPACDPNCDPMCGPGPSPP